jgi:putative intracellular protease/amidase
LLPDRSPSSLNSHESQRPQCAEPCALCHGVAILRYAKLSNGEFLAKGKTVTGFANVEEDFADNAVWSMNLLPRDKHVMPWRIDDEMKKLGANYVQAGPLGS